jgi:hypothetical protein
VSHFDDARKRAFRSDLIRLFRGQPTNLLPFDAVREKLRLRSTVDRGVEEVLLDRIVGTLGRERDFNRLFFPRGESLRQRWENVRRVALGQQGFSMIELYKVGEAYFVLDGHHRVSVARAFGTPAIEAHVREFVTDVPLGPDDSLEQLALRRGRADFHEATGLDLEATEAQAYERQLEHISVHAWYRQQPWADGVASWRERVYEPMLEIIRRAGIMEQFPGRTGTDLYLYAMDHLYYLRQRGENPAPARAIEVMQTVRATWRQRWRRWISAGKQH